MSSPLPEILSNLRKAAAAVGHPPPVLLAVSKTRPAEAVAALAAQGQRAFGENYVQEGLAKIQALRSLALEWHLVGHLQTNKAEAVAQHFDWVQSVDRAKLVAALGRHRSPEQPPLNVLIQVNIDDEDSKHGCAPGELPALADAVAAQPRLALRGLMAIPAPWPESARRRAAFARMHALFKALADVHPQVDTLSMGMSDDYADAIAEGATMVRIGTALFGARPAGPVQRREPTD